METLTFSLQELRFLTDCGKDDGTTITLSFYDGDQFLHRRTKDDEQSSSQDFEDTEIVFEGEVDETKITYEERNVHEVYISAAAELENQEYEESLV